MTIASETSRVNYTGDGATDTYSYSFKIYDDDDLTVTVRDTDEVETTLTKTTDYTVTGVGETSGGTVVLVNASQAWLDSDGDLLTSYVLTIRRVMDLTQTTDIRNQGDYYPEGIEDRMDKMTMQIQQLKDETARSVKLQETISPSGVDMTIADSADRASMGLGFNASGRPVLAASFSSGTTATAYALTLLDDSTASEARTTLGATAGVFPVTVGGTGLSTATTGDILYASAANTLSKLAAGAQGKALRMGASIPAWSNANVMVSKTNTDSPYTSTIAEDGVNANAASAAVTVNLPSAATYGANRRWTCRKTDTAYTYAVTISRAGSDTIEGTTAAGGATSAVLYFPFETLVLESDGTSKWYVVDHTYPRGKVAYTPTIAQGTGNGTATSAVYFWRSGGGIFLDGTYTHGSGAPTATITLTLPNSWTKGSSLNSGGALGSAVYFDTSASHYYQGITRTAASTTFQFQGQNGSTGLADAWDGTKPVASGAGDLISFNGLYVPITGFI